MGRNLEMTETKLKHVLGKSKYPGKAFFFNHETYTDDYPYKPLTRNGTNSDEANLRATFEGLQFEVEPQCKDYTKSELQSKISEYASQSYEDYGCVVVVVMTHGNRNGLLCAKDDHFHTTDVWKPFLDNSSLKNKPKIFIFLACRGATEEDKSTDEAPSRRDPPAVITPKVLKLHLPNAPEVLVIYSTVEGMSSHRVSDGTWYGQTLTKELPSFKLGYDLLSVLTCANRDMVNTRGTAEHGTKQTPCFVSYLSKPIIWKLENDDETTAKALDIKIETEDEIAGPSNEFGESSKIKEIKSEPVEHDALVGEIKAQSDIHSTYALSHRLRGPALILFDETHQEVKNDYEKLLKEDLNFNTLSKQFKSKNEIGKHIEEFKDLHGFGVNRNEETTRFTRGQCFVLIILSKLRGELLQIGNETMSTADVYMKFSSLECPQLSVSPKLCFFLYNFVPPTPKVERDFSINENARSVNGSAIRKTVATEHSDFLVMRAYAATTVAKVLSTLKDSLDNEEGLLTQLTYTLQNEKTDSDLCYLESTLQHQVKFKIITQQSIAEENDALHKENETLKKDKSNLEQQLLQAVAAKNQQIEPLNAIEILLTKANTYKEQEGFTEALSVYSEIHKIYLMAYGEKHEKTKAIHLIVAECSHKLNKAGRNNEALYFYKELLRLMGELEQKSSAQPTEL